MDCMQYENRLLGAMRYGLSREPGKYTFVNRQRADTSRWELRSDTLDILEPTALCAALRLLSEAVEEEERAVFLGKVGLAAPTPAPGPAPTSTPGPASTLWAAADPVAPALPAPVPDQAVAPPAQVSPAHTSAQHCPCPSQHSATVLAPPGPSALSAFGVGADSTPTTSRTRRARVATSESTVLSPLPPPKRLRRTGGK